MKLRDLFVQLGVDVDTDKVESFDKALEDVKTTMGDVAKGAAILGTAIMGAFAGLGMLASRESEFAEEVQRNAQAFGMATDMYQKMRFAFLSLNASSDDLTDALASVSDRIYKARKGQAEYVKSFKDLNIEMKELEGMSPDQAFFRVTSAMRGMDDVLERTALGAQIFGEDLNRRLAPGIMATSGSMEHFMRMASESGLVIDEELIAKATKAQQHFRELGAVFQGVVRHIGIRLAPAFGRLAQSISTAILQVGIFIQQTTKKFGKFFDEEVQKFIDYFKAINDFVQQYGGGWVSVLTKLAAVLGVIVSVFSGGKIYMAFMAIKLAAAKAGGALLLPFIKFILIAALVAAAVIAIVIVIEDLMAYFTGARSWIGDFIDGFKEGNGVLGDFVRFIEKTLDAIKWLASYMGAAFGFMVDVIKEWWEESKGYFQIFLGVIAAVIIIVLALGLAIVGTVLLAIATLFFLAKWVVRIMTAIGKVFLWFLDLLVDNFWGAWAGVEAFFLLLFGHTDKAMEKFEKMGRIAKGVFDKVGGGLSFIASLNPFGGDDDETPAPAAVTPTGPGMLAREFAYGGARGGGGGNNVQVGDVKVEVAVPEGTDVSEAVAHQTGEQVLESVARNVNAGAGN